MGALETGKSLADQILAKLPEALRADVSKALTAPEAADALTLLGDAALARSDYSRAMDDIKAKETQLTDDYTNLKTWYDQHKGKLEGFDALKAEHDKLKAGLPPDPKLTSTTTAMGMSKEDVEKLLTERDSARDAGYANVLAITTTLATRHMKDFNEVLDVNALVQHAMKHRVPLYDPKADTDAYRALHGEKVTAKATADENARIEKLVTERLATERKNQGQPFPVRGGVEPSVLDSLQETDRTTKYTADSAAAMYQDLVANTR